MVSSPVLLSLRHINLCLEAGSSMAQCLGGMSPTFLPEMQTFDTISTEGYVIAGIMVSIILNIYR